MNIACIAWGSLVWDPRELPIRGEWFTDGPLLPVEFCRQSNNGRITLVLCKGKTRVRTLWVLLDTQELNDAIAKLRSREGFCRQKEDEWVGRWVKGESNDGVDEHIAAWAVTHSLDAVIWTALPPKFNNKEEYIPGVEQVVDYLTDPDLDFRKYRLSKEYVRKTPLQIDTEYRRRIERELGWTPISG